MRPWLRESLSIVVAFTLSFAVVFGTRTSGRDPHDASRLRGRASVPDATGRQVPVRRYARIASGSMLVDRILLEVVEPDRVLGFSRHGYEGSTVAFRFGDRARIDPNADLEAMVSLRPDLLIVNNFVDPGRVRRLTEAGIEIFDLGEMRGLPSLLEDIRAIGELVGEPARGDALARSFASRMRAVAAGIPAESRPTAIYVGVHGTQIFGGARDTSYHDVLEAAGLVDVAASRFRGWPSYTNEDILSLAPQRIVSPRGQGRAICRLSGLEALGACTSPNGIVEIEPGMMVDPGLTMLDAAEAVRDAVYGSGAP